MECQSSLEQGPGPRPARPPAPTRSGSERQTVVTYTDIQCVYNKATTSAQKGLVCDEEDRNSDAISSYNKALAYINQVLAVDCENIPGATADHKNSAKEIQLKLTKTKLQIEYRLQALQSLTQASDGPSMAELMDQESPPSYDEVMSSGSTVQISQNGDSEMMALGDSIMAFENADNSLAANATCVFQISDGVQIFFITPEGYVSAPSYPSSLRIFKFLDQTVQVGATNEQTPPAFMQVNEWVYPLIPDTSPALHTSYGAYMFPDTASQAPGAAVGLILPDELLQGRREEFEVLMRSLTVMEDQQAEPVSGVAERPRSQEDVPQRPRVAEEDDKTGQPTTSTRISKGVLVAAEWISWGVQKGAQQAGKLIHYGSEKVQEHINPKNEASKIDPKVQKAANYVRKGSHTAVKVSGFVVSKLGEATAALGRFMSPHIRKQGEKLLRKSGCRTESSRKAKMDGVFEVAASGIIGFGTVYAGLETAAKELARSMANETVQIVNRKYGKEAGQLASNTLYSVGNVAMTAYTAENLGVKAIAKRAAKDTGKAVLYDLQEKSKEKVPPQPEQQSSKDFSSHSDKKPAV